MKSAPLGRSEQALGRGGFAERFQHPIPAQLDAWSQQTVALGLGLFSFVEPCSVGSHLIFLKFLDRLPKRQRLLQTLVLTAVRAALMAGLGVLAVLIGANFLGVQHNLDV